MPLVAHSAHVVSFHVMPSHMRGQSVVEQVQRVACSVGAKVILPVTERSTTALARHAKVLKHFEGLAPLPVASALAIATDKFELARFMEANGIPHPKTWAAVESDWKTLRFPLLVKPRKKFGGKGIVKVRSRRELLAVLAPLNAEEFFLQEYIAGSDFGCSVLMKEGKVKAVTVQCGRDRPRDFGPFSVLEMKPCTKVRSAAEALMEALKWSGVAHVDLRRDRRTGRVLVLEINCRYWGSLFASTCAGVNFPDLACRLALRERFKSPRQQSGLYVKWTQIVSDLLRLRLRVLHVSASELGFIRDDPVPNLVRCWRRALKALRPAVPVAALGRVLPQVPVVTYGRRADMVRIT